jgi:23S rRNA (guanosine2251-2'-O)-methyltransferase
VAGKKHKTGAPAKGPNRGDRRDGAQGAARPPFAESSEGTRGQSGAPKGAFWLYGFHAARAALANPRRTVRKALLTARAAAEMGRDLPRDLAAEPADPEALTRLLPYGAVHQGIALYCEPLPPLNLEEVLGRLPVGKRLVAVLDQITDPHNEGAILRSAAAFGVAAVIVQDRHAPPESGALAKAASGALDIVPRVPVVNIARALDDLGKMRFWRIALAGDAGSSLREVAREGDIAIVLGAEGAGVRRLVRETCDASAFIPMSGAMESLNVSNAAAIALYELSGLGR